MQHADILVVDMRVFFTLLNAPPTSFYSNSILNIRAAFDLFNRICIVSNEICYLKVEHGLYPQINYIKSKINIDTSANAKNTIGDGGSTAL